MYRVIRLFWPSPSKREIVKTGIQRLASKGTKMVNRLRYIKIGRRK
jgi:hypothetical protein